MKYYYITLYYSVSALCAMENALLEEIKAFEGCCLDSTQLEALRRYLMDRQNALANAHPRWKNVSITLVSDNPCYLTTRLLVGQITLVCHDVKPLPEQFVNYMR